MRLSPIAIALSSMLWLSTPAAQALGFGRVSTATVLGQPLNFGAAVRIEGDETLVRECVWAEVDSGDRRLPAAVVRVSIEPGASAAERWIRVTTSTQIDEPVVAVQVTLGCNGGLTRRFVSFIDPPAIALAHAEAPAEAPAMPTQRLESTVSPIVAIAQSAAPVTPAAASAASSAAPSPAADRPRRDAPAPRPRRELVEAPADAPAPVARPRPKPAPKPRVVAAAPADAGARLKLDAPAVVPVAPAASAPAPAPVVAAAPPEPAASAAAVVTDTALAEELKRLKSLEDDVRAVRDQTLAAQTAMVALQTRLKEAEESRYANPLVYGLASLSALLAIAVAGLWWRQSQSPTRGASPWWSPVPEPAPAAPRRSVPPRAATSGFGAEGAAAPAVKLETVPAVMDERPMPPTVTENVVPRRMAASVPVPPPAPPEPAGFPATAFPHTQAPDDKRRELAVEELIDLEQQAEFFIVLGQEDAAIDLLMGHLRSTGGASPLPYLKLLEIYRRRGDREAYERIRSRFNRRFNAYAPDWDADLQQGRSLEDHPQLMARIQKHWKDPGKVMLMLDGALLQRDELAEPFDLPACRDLLFLYSVARDLAENEGKLPSIDLLLPLDDEASDAESSRGVMSLDLDVSSPDSASGPVSSILGLADGRPTRR